MEASTNEVISLFSKYSGSWDEMDSAIWTTQWRNLGSNLSFSAHELDLIEQIAAHRKCLSKVLIESWVNKSGSQATIVKLMDALSKANYGQLVNRISEWSKVSAQTIKSPHIRDVMTSDAQWRDLELEMFGDCLEKDALVREGYKLANALSMEFDRKEYDIRRVKIMVQNHSQHKNLVYDISQYWSGRREFTVANFSRILDSIGKSRAADIVRGKKN